MKFIKGSLTNQLLEQNRKCLHVYDLDGQPRHSTNNFRFKNHLFGENIVVKSSDKENHVYNGYGITSDSAGQCSFEFCNFGVDHSYSSHADNHKNDFLALVKDPIHVINGSFSSPEKKY